ncbi:hypothetical protein V8G54_024295 [Vigna mungo]|uniref:Uncharacterized protein n=1 Tax=Vigna mungo TaxID=3915 RepID=A0AAQ3RQ02_VIGMU
MFPEGLLMFRAVKSLEVLLLFRVVKSLQPLQGSVVPAGLLLFASAGQMFPKGLLMFRAVKSLEFVAIRHCRPFICSYSLLLFAAASHHPEVEVCPRPLLSKLKFVQKLNKAIYGLQQAPWTGLVDSNLPSFSLTYDRQWILKSPTGEILTQKKSKCHKAAVPSLREMWKLGFVGVFLGRKLWPTSVPEMGFVSTLIDLSQGILFVESPRCKERLQITLESNVYEDAIEDIELYGQSHLIIMA